jgi:hypothetical protein
MRASVHADAARILTLSCLAAVADAVARRTACDVPSLFSLHYSGEAPGPTCPFGFDVGLLRAETERMRFCEAALLARRTQVLDYFEGVWRLMLSASSSEIVRERHVLFRFEETMRFGDAEHILLSQLTWAVGYPSHGFPENEGLPSEAAAVRSPQPWRYLTGETRELLDDMPILEGLRDIAFLLKLALAPSREHLPPERTYHVTDAILTDGSRAPPPRSPHLPITTRHLH